MLLYIIIIFIAILISAWFWVYKTAPQFPSNTNKLIQEVMSSELPDFMPGKNGFAKNGNIKIAYEVLESENSSKGNILLVNGHTQTLLEWQPYFYQPLLEAGYRVIRYDNRGFGMSDWIPDWINNNKYTLTEMATDGIAVLDHLGIEKAHIMGSSMGGMIGQTMAINHSKRVLSLTSIMSTGFYFDPELVDVPKPFFRKLVKLILRLKSKMHLDETKLKFQLGVRHILKGNGNYELDTKTILQQFYFEIKNRAGYNSKANDQHGYAIKKSGSRYEDLKKLDVPTLVVHGTDDTLILVNHAKKYAPMIPNSELLLLDGMGHDIPEKYTPEILESVFSLFDKAYKEEN